MRCLLLLCLVLPLLADPAMSGAQECSNYQSHSGLISIVDSGLQEGLSIVTKGNLAYISGNSLSAPFEDLAVLDISDPTQPLLLGAALTFVEPIGYPFSGLDVSGGRAYKVSGNFLSISDLSDPTIPGPWLGGINLGSPLRQTRAIPDSDRVLVAGTDALFVVNATDPASPLVLAQLPLPGGAWDIDLLGNVACLAGSNSLNFVDLSVPTAPVLIGSHPLARAGRAVVWGSDVVFVGSGSPDPGIYAFGVSDPTTPVLLGDLSGTVATELKIDDVSGRLVTNSLKIVDISDPSAMVVEESLAGTGGSIDVVAGRIWTVNGNLLKGFQRTGAGLVTAESAVTNGTYHEVLTDGDTAYAPGYVDGGYVVDILDCAHPGPLLPRLGRAPILIGGQFGDIVFGSGRVAAAFESTVSLVDVSDPTSPTTIGTVVNGKLVHNLALGIGHLYVTDDDGLTVYDVTDPGNPVQVGALSIAFFAEDMVLDGALLYLADSLDGLRIIDVSDPTQPSQRGIAGGVRGECVLKAGDNVYLGHNDLIHTIDVADPDAPSLIASLPLPAEIGGMAMQGDKLAVAVEHSALFYDLGTAGNPVTIMGQGAPYIREGQVGAPKLTGAAAAGERILIAQGTHGLGILSQPCAGLAPVRDLPNAVTAGSLQAHPNPFNPSTTISFTLSESGPATLRIYGVDGRLVAEPMAKYMGRGKHTLRWDGRDNLGREVGSGVYLMELATPTLRQTGRVMMIK